MCDSDCSTTNNNYLTIYALRQTTSLASYETATILCGNIRISYLHDQQDHHLSETRLEIFRYDREWYSLLLGTTFLYILLVIIRHGVNWYPGSYIALKGEYGNVIIKQYAYQNLYGEYMFYRRLFSFFLILAGYLVEKEDEWKIKSGLVSGYGWRVIDYDDSRWTVSTLSSMQLVSGTGIVLRRVFDGMEDLNVITVSVTYQCGIIAFLQNHELYRDNIPEGPFSEATRATACYQSAITRLITRSCKDCSPGKNVLAVALFSISGGHIHLNQTSIWLTPQGDMSSDSSSAFKTCHMIDVDYETSSAVQRSERMVDYNYLTSFTADVSTPLTISLSNTERYLVMNGIMFVNLNHSLLLPLTFEVYGKRQSEWHLIGRSFQGTDDFPDRTIALFPFNNEYYPDYQIRILSTRSLLLEITELRLLSCLMEIPTSLELNTHDVEAIMLVDSIEVFPVYEGFINCTLNRGLPPGLSFDASTCSVTGRTETEFNETFIMYASSTRQYSATFHIVSRQCQGMVILFTRRYGEDPSLETFTITNANTKEVVYNERSNSFQHSFYERDLRFCLPFSHFSITLNHENSLMWGCDSFLTVSIVLVNDTIIPITTARYDKHVGLDSIIHFSTMLLIHPNSEWSFFSGSVPSSDWMLKPTSSWPSSHTESIPSAPIQLFHKSFSVTNVVDMFTFHLYIRYRAGCIVYINGMEIFRRFLNTTFITNTSQETGSYDSMIYRVVSFPQYLIMNDTVSQVIHEGENWIAIGLVTKNASQPTTFDCSLRIGPRQKRLLNFDYDVEVEGYESNVDVLMDLCSSTHFTFRGSESNSITIRFKDDRREWASMFDVLASLTMKKEPTTATIEAKNPEDSEWTILSENENWYWWSRGIYKIVYLLHNKAYNMFRIRDITLNHESWSLTSLLLYQYGLDSYLLPNVTYRRIEGYIGYPISEFYPSSAYCNNYYSQSSLPDGLFLDPATGVIGGTPTSPFDGDILINTLFLSMFTVTTSVHITVTTCSYENSIIIINAYSESYSNNEFLRLYEGRNHDLPFWDFTCPSSSQYDYIFTFCLSPSIYTLTVSSVDNNGWLFPAGYAISIRKESIVMSIGHVADGGEHSISVFSAKDPFPVTAECVYVVDTVVSTSWSMRGFDDTDWNYGNLHSLPSSFNSVLYIRYAMHISSLFDYRVLGVTVHYSTCFIAYYNHNRVARMSIESSPSSSSYCSETIEGVKTVSFYILLSETGGEEGKNCLSFEIHQNSLKQAVIFEVEGYYGVDDVNEFYNLIDDPEEKLNPLLDSNIKSFIQVDSKIGNLFDITFKNWEGQSFNSLTYYCDQSIPIYNFKLFMKSRFSSQTPHPDYQNNLEFLCQEDISSIKGRLKSVVSVPYGMGDYQQLRIYGMYYQLDNSYLQFSGILPSYTFLNTRILCPGIKDYHSVKVGQISPGPCPVNMTGVSTRFCNNNAVFGDPNYSRCSYIPPANVTYQNTDYSFVVGVWGVIEPPSYLYYVSAFSVTTKLPAGLVLDTKTGGISGIPSEGLSFKPFTIVASNPGGEERVILSLEVQQLFCSSTIEKKQIPLFSEEWIDCKIYDKGIGRMKRRCDFLYGEPIITMKEYCISSIGLVAIFVIAICVAIVLYVVVKKSLSIYRIMILSRKLYYSSS